MTAKRRQVQRTPKPGRDLPAPPSQSKVEAAIDRVAAAPPVGAVALPKIELVMEPEVVGLKPDGVMALDIPDQTPQGPHLVLWLADSKEQVGVNVWRGVRLPPGRWLLRRDDGAQVAPRIVLPGSRGWS